MKSFRGKSGISDVQFGRNRLNARQTAGPSAYVLLGLVLLVFFADYQSLPEASAQSPPIFPSLPPSFNGQVPNTGTATVLNDRERPRIELLTTELHQGKNVIAVKIDDASYLQSRQVKYVDDGKIAFADLARDHDNIYYALINVKPPSSIIEIDVIDSSGNRAKVVEEIPVGPPPGFDYFLGRIVTLLSNVGSDLWNLIGILGPNN